MRTYSVDPNYAKYKPYWLRSYYIEIKALKKADEMMSYSMGLPKAEAVKRAYQAYRSVSSKPLNASMWQVFRDMYTRWHIIGKLIANGNRHPFEWQVHEAFVRTLNNRYNAEQRQAVWKNARRYIRFHRREDPNDPITQF